MTTIGWVTGTTDLTAPGVALAVTDAGAGPVETLTLTPVAAMTPLGVGVHQDVRVVVGMVEDDQLLVSANVDDLDPRVWPSVLAALLAAGAADAWLTPILMKKGRPAHTISALLGGERLPEVSAVILAETTSIGLRVQPVGKLALRRAERTVLVDDQRIRVKIALDPGGDVINVMPEWDDVAAAATVLNQPARVILNRAHLAAAPFWAGP